MAQVGTARRARKLASTDFSVILTVVGSTASVDTTGSSWKEGLPLTFLNRVKEKATSSAVSVLPVLNLTSVRSLKT